MILHADQRREWIKSRRKQRKLARTARLRRQLFRYVVLLALLVVGGSAFTRLPWWINDVTRDVTVRGNYVASPEQVRSKVADLVGVPLFSVDPKKVEERVKELEPIKHAFVRRYALPRPHIVVEVLEEFPWATFSSVPDKPPEFVIAQSGRMIPIKTFPNVIQPPLKVYGQPSMRMRGQDVMQWGSWLNYISEQTKMPVESVDMRKPFDVCVANGDLYLKLGTPDTTLTRRLGRLTSVLAAIEHLKQRLEYINLGLDNNIPMKLAKGEPRKEEAKQRDKTAIAAQEQQPQM